MCGLHDQAPVHSYAVTAAALRNAFGMPLDALFESFEREPLASGSVAQVHRARLRQELTPLCPRGCRDVAVKAREGPGESNRFSDALCFRCVFPTRSVCCCCCWLLSNMYSSPRQLCACCCCHFAS